MARDVSDVVRGALGNVAREALKNVGDVKPPTKSKSGPLSGAKGIAAGMGLAAAAPLAKKGVDAVRKNGKPSGKPGGFAAKAASMAGDRVGGKLKDAVSEKVDEAGGAGGLVKEAAGGLLPFGGGGDDSKGKGGTPGVGKGRRMPIQQSVDVAVPIETAYNQWTQFEEWSQFMHRITNVSQDDECTVKFSSKIWTRKREFEAKIITQRPDDRVKWRVAQGITHTGVVSFHEIAPRLTRMELTMDVDPGSLIEKIARGARHIKRAARADLHRYKAFIEMLEHETGAWRGVIEDGELIEDHDPAYDENKDYADVEDLYDEAEISRDEDEDEDEDEGDKSDEEEQNGNGSGRERTQRFKRQAERSRTAAASRGDDSSRSPSSGGSGRSKSSSSGGSGRSKSSSSGGSGRSKSSSSGGSGRSKSSSGSSSSSGRSRSGNSKSSGSTSSSSRRKSTSRS
jgi:uncharacterized membrane protein